MRLVLNGDRIAAEEHFLKDRHMRVREVRQDPDGNIYLLTSLGLMRVTSK